MRSRLSLPVILLAALGVVPEADRGFSCWRTPVLHGVGAAAKSTALSVPALLCTTKTNGVWHRKGLSTVAQGELRTDVSASCGCMCAAQGPCPCSSVIQYNSYRCLPQLNAFYLCTMPCARVCIFIPSAYLKLVPLPVPYALLLPLL